MKVTEKKLAANRRNARRSTGPKTERGKNTSRFNAVTTGLFAKHVVIPDDGVDADPYQGNIAVWEFARLLEALEQEYQPEGPMENFWVAQMAECVWKQRRISRSESRLVCERAKQESAEAYRIHLEYSRDLWKGIDALANARKEIKNTHALSQATVTTLFGALTPWPNIAESVMSSGPDNDRLIASIEDAWDRLERREQSWAERVPNRSLHALPENSDMEQILRYDKALQKKFDWALQRLLESQARRRQARPTSRIHLIK